jgi:hypothetical protein
MTISYLPWRVSRDGTTVIILGGPFGRSLIASLGEGEGAEADAQLIVAAVHAHLEWPKPTAERVSK